MPQFHKPVILTRRAGGRAHPALHRDPAPDLLIAIAGFTFEARLETTAAPATCDAFRRHLPLESEAVHVRWSGEALWIPFGNVDFGVGFENQTSYPAPGQVLLHPGGAGETEIIFAYGAARFASKVGQLAGNHFITLTSGLDCLPALGRVVLWEGAKDIRFAEV